eukprot:6190250-Amphidinium_carterae.1
MERRPSRTAADTTRSKERGAGTAHDSTNTGSTATKCSKGESTTSTAAKDAAGATHRARSSSEAQAAAPYLFQSQTKVSTAVTPLHKAVVPKPSSSQRPVPTQGIPSQLERRPEQGRAAATHGGPST